MGRHFSKIMGLCDVWEILGKGGNNLTEIELILKYPIRKFGEINIKRDVDYWVSGLFDDNNVADLGWKIYLDNFKDDCDEWLIGNIVEAEQFFRDLGQALEYCRNNP